MSKNRKTRTYPYWSPVPNNPIDNEFYVDKEEKKKEVKFNQDNMLFDNTLQKIVSRREPGEPIKTQHLSVDTKQFARDLKVWKKRNQQSAARERLKSKGAVPTRAATGKKLFEDFCREAYKCKIMRIEDSYASIIYNAANHLSYEDWILFVTKKSP
jgi:hypothetical protein